MSNAGTMGPGSNTGTMGSERKNRHMTPAVLTSEGLQQEESEFGVSLGCLVAQDQCTLIKPRFRKNKVLNLIFIITTHSAV